MTKKKSFLIQLAILKILNVLKDRQLITANYKFILLLFYYLILSTFFVFLLIFFSIFTFYPIEASV